MAAAHSIVSDENPPGDTDSGIDSPRTIPFEPTGRKAGTGRGGKKPVALESGINQARILCRAAIEKAKPKAAELAKCDPIYSHGIMQVVAVGREGVDHFLGWVKDGDNAARFEAIEAEVREAFREYDEAPVPPIDPDKLPEIRCGFEDKAEGLKTWTPKAIDAISRAFKGNPYIFQRDHKLVRLSKPIDEKDQPSIAILTPAALRGVLDRVACWSNDQATRKGVVPKYGPPRIEIVQDILSADSYDVETFPPLEMVAESPVFAADGRLVQEPGYHAEGRLYYAPRPELRDIRIPDRPAPEEVADALALIFDDLLVNFPFKNSASKANALGVMLLPFVRLMINGPTPNHHFAASTEGVGKGKCAAACAFPFLGREVAINPQKESEAEWRKALTSFFMSGSTHFFIDNLNNPCGWDGSLRDIESGTLAAAWTGNEWRDRILGGQEQARIVINSVFMSSGNNVTFSRELTRRLVMIDLVAVSEDPSTRTGFKHPDLFEWARENRKKLTTACLLLVQNWIAQGRKPGKTAMGSYEAYARTIGGILDAAGVGDFLGNRPRTGAGRDRESLRWPPLVRLWLARHGTKKVTTADLYKMVFNAVGGSPGADLQVLFADVVGDGSDLSKRQKFGSAVLKQDGKVWADYRIVKDSKMASGGSPQYYLLDPNEAIEAEWFDELDI